MASSQIVAGDKGWRYCCLRLTIPVYPITRTPQTGGAKETKEVIRKLTAACLRIVPLPVLLATLALSAGAAEPKKQSFDPELTLLVNTVQRQSVALVHDELVRQAEWLELGGMKVHLAERGDEISRRVRATLKANSDVLDDYRTELVRVSPGTVGEVDKLVAEIRRYHDLVPGQPLQRVPVPEKVEKGPELLEEPGVGEDVAAAMRGEPALNEPVQYAERRFGLAGPFLRRRRWNLDFYLGSFEDLLPHYRRLGYKSFYRLRAPYVSYGRQAYVLTPEAGLRPRLVLCAFFGTDLFRHTRAQWAVLAERAQAPEGEGPVVRTLSCPGCSWVLPGVAAMRELISGIPFTADNVVVGYDYLFEEAWGDRRLGAYENDYWKLTYYRTEPTVTAVLLAKHSNFGEILAHSLTALVRRGARRVFYSGPAAQVDPRLDDSQLALPTDFASFSGVPEPFDNALAPGRRKQTVFVGLPSPLYATKEWFENARKAGVGAFDGEMARLAEEAARWKKLPGRRVECGIAATLGTLLSLHPEEDRAVYTVTLANQVGREPAKRRFRELVLEKLAEDRRKSDD